MNSWPAILIPSSTPSTANTATGSSSTTTAPTPADLGGCFLTDNLTNQFQFQIPAGVSIAPRSFLLVWADGKSTNGTTDLHVTFKMNKGGESLGLFGADGTPLDFVTYGAQADDISIGRFPDGSAAFHSMPTPSPRTNNILPNTAPVLSTLSNQFIYPGQTLGFAVTATDAESAFQSLSFSLDPASPAGAAINPVTGWFSWTATNAAAPGTNLVAVRVTDDGTPPMSDSASFAVIVMPTPQLARAAAAAGTLKLSFATLPGQDYQAQYKDDLAAPVWTPLGNPIAGDGLVHELEDATSREQRFYRLVIAPR